MQTAVSVKAGGAFLAGVALALGGAYTYFKLADPRPVVQPQEAQQVVQQEAQQVAQPVAKVTPAPAPEPAPSPVVETAEPKIIHPKLVLPKPRVTSRPVSLAMATPPPASSQQPAPVPDPTPDPVPAPAPAQVFTAPVPQPPPPAAEPQPHTVTIAQGTSVAVRLNEKISTDHNYTGDTFRATLEAPLVVDGFIIADRGAKVLGKVVKAQKPGKLEGAAELSLALTEISTTDGQHLHVETNQSLRKGPSNTTQEAEKMGGGAALGAIIGAIAGGGKGAAIGLGAGGAAGAGAVLLGHGKPAVIDNETRLTFTLSTPATITEQLHSR